MFDVDKAVWKTRGQLSASEMNKSTFVSILQASDRVKAGSNKCFEIMSGAQIGQLLAEM